jgi:HD domain
VADHEDDTVEGQRVLDQVGGFIAASPASSARPRGLDGGGYPDGLAGAAIPVEKRIIPACATWNAMTTTRSWSRPLRTRR